VRNRKLKLSTFFSLSKLSSSFPTWSISKRYNNCKILFNNIIISPRIGGSEFKSQPVHWRLLSQCSHAWRSEMHSTLQKIAVLIQHNAVSQRDYHFLHVFYYLEPYISPVWWRVQETKFGNNKMSLWKNSHGIKN